MMKKIIHLVAVLICFVCLTSCENQNEKLTEITVTKQEEQTTVKYETEQSTSNYEEGDITETREAKIFAEINGFVSAGIIFDNNKSMYVAKNDELVKVTPDGTVSTFCSFADITDTKNYYFNSPLIWDMTFDSDGNILAAAQDRIIRITPEGKAETIIREDFNGFLGASGIECDSNGNIYITNGSKIEKYNSELEKSTFIDGEKDGYRGFFSLEFDPDGKNLYISDFFIKSLVKYEVDSNGNAVDVPIQIVRNPIERSGDFGAPLNITFSENGIMYVSIDGMGKILKMDTDGTIGYIDLGELHVSNHIIAFGGNGFNEESLYITSYYGKNIYECNVGEKGRQK